MTRLLKIILSTFAFVCVAAMLCAYLFWLPVRSGEDKRYSSAYEWSAIDLLAFDAARDFPRAREEKYENWQWVKPTPCLQKKYAGEAISENARRYDWDSWPPDGSIDCNDILISKRPRGLLQPSVCTPYVIWRLPNGQDASYALAIAKGSDLVSLETARVPSSRLQAISRGDRLRSDSLLSKFVAGGGIEGVAVTFVSKSACAGMDIFRYRSEVRDYPSLRSQLDKVGYRVYPK